MQPLGLLQLVLVGLEGLAHALNPELRSRSRKSAMAFGVLYAGAMLAGLVTVVLVVRTLYFGQ